MDVSIWGEALPNWIAAGAAAVAVIFAGVAGKWAKKAAESAAEQAAETRNEVQIAERQLEIARADLEHANTEAAQTQRITLESRLDLLAPTIYASAALHDPAKDISPGVVVHGPLEFRTNTDQEWWPLTSAEREFEAEIQQSLQFRIQMDLVVRNVSDMVAVIGMERNSSRGEFDWQSGSTRAIEPRGEITISWSRIWTPDQLASAESINDTANRIFDHSIMVWDIGYRIEDRYRLFAGLAFFTRDGSRLVASREPQAAPEWQQGVIAAHVGRTYDALDRSE